MSRFLDSVNVTVQTLIAIGSFIKSPRRFYPPSQRLSSSSSSSSTSASSSSAVSSFSSSFASASSSSAFSSTSSSPSFSSSSSTSISVSRPHPILVQLYEEYKSCDGIYISSISACIVMTDSMEFIWKDLNK